jgi:Na+/H+ antiporter NhaA
MSLFIAGLAFPDAGLLAASKTGILAASLLSAVLGAGVLMRASSPPIARAEAGE